MQLVQSLKTIIKQRSLAFQRFLSEISHEGEDLERRRKNRLVSSNHDKFGCWRHRGIW